MTEIPENDRTFALPVEQSLSLVIVRLTDMVPLARETMVEYGGDGFLRQLVFEGERQPNDLIEEFSYEALAARHKFKESARKSDGATTEPDAASG